MQLSINVNAPAGAKIEKLITPLEYFGIVLVIVLIIAIVIVAVYCCCKKRKANASAVSY